MPCWWSTWHLTGRTPSTFNELPLVLANVAFRVLVFECMVKQVRGCEIESVDAKMIAFSSVWRCGCLVHPNSYLYTLAWRSVVQKHA
jgi:hypothetical protein